MQRHYDGHVNRQTSVSFALYLSVRSPTPTLTRTHNLPQHNSAVSSNREPDRRFRSSRILLLCARVPLPGRAVDRRRHLTSWGIVLALEEHVLNRNEGHAELFGVGATTG